MGKKRPRYVPTEEKRQMVENCAGVGIPHALIATIIGIDDNTLYRHHREELDRGKARASVKYFNTLYDMATSGKCPAATFFWGKTQYGLKEVQVHEHTEGPRLSVTFADVNPNGQLTERDRPALTPPPANGIPDESN